MGKSIEGGEARDIQGQRGGELGIENDGVGEGAGVAAGHFGMRLVAANDGVTLAFGAGAGGGGDGDER